MLRQANRGAAMDIGGWLRGLGLERYEAAFRENEVDADVLRQLTADDLKDLGVAAVGHRRRLLGAIAKLQGDAAVRVHGDSFQAGSTVATADLSVNPRAILTFAANSSLVCAEQVR